MINNYFSKLTIFALAFFSPISGAMIAVLFLLAIDFITGIWAAKKRKVPVTSHKMWPSVTKFILYCLAIISGHLVEQYLCKDIPFVRVATGLIATIEITSIWENIYKITGLNLIKALKDYLPRKEK